MTAEGSKYRVGISGSYGGLNLGDEAILRSMVTQLRNSLPVELTVCTRDPEDTRQRHGVERALPIRDLTRDEARAEIERGTILITVPYIHNTLAMQQVTETMVALNKPVNLTADMPKHADTACMFGGVIMIIVGAIAGLRSQE